MIERWRLAMWLAPWFALTGAIGCVHVYQPLSGLHRPVIVDPQLANFQDVRLNVHCVPEGLLNGQQAGALCRRVATLFENQGAIVTTSVGERDAVVQDTGSSVLPGLDEPVEAAVSDEPSTDLSLELRAREVHKANNLLSWAICLGTFTVVPAVTESHFAQDVVIRDGTGFVLVSETLQGRIVRRFGAGTWLGNHLLDLVVRDEADKLMGNAVKEDLSGDLYRQLSQLVFNANMQWQVLKQAGR